MTTKVAIYARVSTEEQSTDNQMLDIERYCDTHGYEVADIYRENESAWKDGHQTELARFISELRGGRRKYEVLVVWALDRLSRQGPLAVLTLIDTLKHYGVKVESVQEPFTSLPYGFDSVIYSFFAWIAKYESDRRSERTRAGLARARASGKTLGRPKGSKDSKPRRKKRPVVLRRGG